MGKELLPNAAKFVEASIGKKRFNLNKDESIFRQGDSVPPSFSLYVVTDGMIALQKERNRKTAIVSVLPAGDIFGFEDFVGCEGTRSFSSTALMPSSVTRYNIPQERVIDMLPDLLTASIEEQERFQEILKLGTSQKKIAQALLEFAQDDRVRVSQTVIGQRIGAGRDTVNRIIGVFIDKGLIEAPSRVTGQKRNQQELLVVEASQLQNIR